MLIFQSATVYDLTITYGSIDDAPIFTFTTDIGLKIIVHYHCTRHGGHQRYIEIYKNGLRHGTQYGWYSIQDGGHQRYIKNYQNGFKHGTQYEWYSKGQDSYQQCIENYQNGHILCGDGYYWDDHGILVNKR
jgi:antitoxin component YwqK of YwqJK toxin-antitoxin module